MTDLIAQDDLELRVGTRTVADLCDDDGDKVADTDVVAWLLKTASREAEGALKPGFPSAAQVATLVAADPSVQNLVVEIACGIMGGRRIATLGPDGKAPFENWRDRALKRLREIGEAKARAAGEETAGANALTRTRTRSGRALLFSSSSSDPKGPGGF